MNGSDLFNAGKKTGKETGDKAREVFEKGKAFGQKENEKGREAGNCAKPAENLIFTVKDE